MKDFVYCREDIPGGNSLSSIIELDSLGSTKAYFLAQVPKTLVTATEVLQKIVLIFMPICGSSRKVIEQGNENLHSIQRGGFPHRAIPHRKVRRRRQGTSCCRCAPGEIQEGAALGAGANNSAPLLVAFFGHFLVRTQESDAPPPGGTRTRRKRKRKHPCIFP